VSPGQPQSAFTGAHRKPGPNCASQSVSLLQAGSLQKAESAQMQDPPLSTAQPPVWQPGGISGQPGVLPQRGCSTQLNTSQLGEPWANAGDWMLIRIGADHATAVPAPIRLSNLLREILSRFSSMDLPPLSGTTLSPSEAGFMRSRP
jgi:hypothetical protein